MEFVCIKNKNVDHNHKAQSQGKYCKTLIFRVPLIFMIFVTSIKLWNKYLWKFWFTSALYVCFHCNADAEYSSVGNTSPGSC